MKLQGDIFWEEE